jgi:type IV fimbrial biogenesis protein FimT
MKKPNQKGFSLLELMVTLSIVAIVMAIAVPNMSQFIKNDRLTSYTNALISDLMLGRGKAVQRNQPVIVCASDDQATCTGGDFKNGWIVAVDIDNDGTVGNADDLIRVQNKIKGDIKYVDGGLNVIIFDSRGFAPNSSGQISICDDRGNDKAKSISISPTGRTSRGGAPSC